MTQPTHTDLQRDFGRMEGRMDALDKAMGEGFSRVETALAKIDEIGDMIVTPATYDEEGNELTPAEIDHRFHVNFRIAEHLNWQPIALAWMLNGNDDAVPNKEEETRTLAKVSLIDPDTVKTPARVWF